MKNTLYGLVAAALLAAAPAAFGQETAVAKHTTSHVHGTRVSSVTDTDSLKATMDSKFTEWSGDVGTNFLKVPAGKQIALTYQAYAEAGDFKIVLRNKDGKTFWEEALPLRSEAVVRRTLPVAKDGEYQVSIAGKGSQGKFNVSWTVE
jgi:hypothetical protein